MVWMCHSYHCDECGRGYPNERAARDCEIDHMAKRAAEKTKVSMREAFDAALKDARS